MRFLSNRRRYPRRRQKHYKFLHLNLLRALVIMYSCSAIHLGPMPRFVFKFIRISVDGEHIENDENDSVDEKHFIRFRGENYVFKFIRISMDGEHIENDENDRSDTGRPQYLRK